MLSIKSSFIHFGIHLSVLLSSMNVAQAQARLIVNGAKINLVQGAYLVIDNPANNAITRNSGHIISEGENNIIKWNIANTIGSITIPWGIADSQYIPLSFTKTSGSGNGYFLFSTYNTTSENSTALPGSVTNFNGASGADKSLLAVDRFWQINAVGYTAKPSLSSVTFTYSDNDFLAPNNTILENRLTTQRWNEDLKTWIDFAPSANTNASANTVTLGSLSPTDFYPWWILNYVEDRHWVATTSSTWSDPLNWSATSGGTGGAGVPTTMDAVILDNNNDVNLTADTEISVDRLIMSDGYSGIFSQGSNVITIKNEAILTGGTFEGGTASIEINGAFTLSGTAFKSTSATLDLKNNFTFAGGSFLHNNGTVKFSGATEQNVNGSSPADFNNLIIANSTGVSIESNQNLFGTVTLTENALLDADGTNNDAIFTLRSTNDSPASDASIAALPAGARITGNVTIQRYMAIEGAGNGRIYRYISSPIQNATVTDIQNEIPVTGTFTGTSICAGCGSGQSMFEYDEAIITDVNNNGINESDDGYRDFPATTNSEFMIPGKGYALYVRGNTLSSARWDVRGNVNAGNEAPVVLPVTYTSSGNLLNDGWNLVGNPFPSTIDWNASAGWTKTNMGTSIYIRDNGSPISQFASWNGIVGINGGSRFIAMGQAFWVKGNGLGSPVLNANENVKVAGTQTTFFREAALQNLLRITLVKGTVRDEAVIHFRDDATDNFDYQADAYKLPGGSFNLSTLLSDNTRLAINSLSTLLCEVTVKVGVENTKAGNYTLDFSEYESFSENVTITLIDDFKKTSHNIKVQGSYNFVVTTDPLSYGINRFRIIFNAANPVDDFTLNSVAVCEGSDALVHIDTAQYGITYTASVNGNFLSSTIGNGQALEIKIGSNNLLTGENKIIIIGANGCNVSVQKEIVINHEKGTFITSVENGSVCKAGIVTLGASGVSENGSYNWFESATATMAIKDQHASMFTTPVLHQSTYYFVSTVNAAGCESARVPVLAEVVQLETIEINTDGDYLVSNYELGNQWYFDNQILEGANGQYLKINQTGNYSVQVTKNGCSATAEYQLTVMGNELETEIKISAYPNPVVDEVTIELPETYEHLKILTVINSNGATVGSIPMAPVNGKLTGKFNMVHLPTGIYIVKGIETNRLLDVKLLKK